MAFVGAQAGVMRGAGAGSGCVVSAETAVVAQAVAVSWN